MAIRAASLLLAIAALWPRAAAAQPIPLGTEIYTLEGIVAKDQADGREVGWFAISVGVVGDAAPARWIGLTAFLDWRQDPFAGRETIRRLLPADPTLLVAGPRDLVTRLQTAPPGSRLAARGMLNFGSRIYMLSAVTVVTPDGK
jgi:hypothetical protein